MKKGIVVLFFTLLLCIGTAAVMPEADGYVYTYYGDLNGDREYGIYDALLLLHNLINRNADPALADANQDGKVTLMDVVRILKVSVGQEEAEKKPVREYYPLSHLENYREKTVSVSVTESGTATAVFSAAYAENGVWITAEVTDAILCDNDYVAINMQAANATVRSDNKEIRFDCYAAGNYTLKRCQYSSSAVSYTTISSGDSLAENEDCYYTYTATEAGYTVSLFASYGFLNVPAEYAYGKVRVYLTLRNDDGTAEGGGSTAAAGDTLGAVYARPDTWLVIDTDGSFIREDLAAVSFANDIPAGNAFADVAFWNELATVSGAAGDLHTAEAGASIFTDRTFGFEERGLPAELVGKSYVCAPIGGTTVTVDKAGYVVLLVNEFDSDSKNQTVMDAGFTRLLFAAKTPGNTATKQNVPDLANWYVKYCEAGESFNFGKWVVAFGAAAETDSFVWETVPGTTVNAAAMEETTAALYAVYDRVWQGIPTGEVTDGGRRIAAWNSGDSGEGKGKNYAILAYSDDGETWNEAYYIAGPKDADGNALATVCDIQIWLDRETDTLHIFYLMSSTLSAFEKSSAVWTCTVKNLDADSVTDWEFSAHRYLFPGLLRNNITVLADGTWLAAPNDYMDDRFTVVYASTDRGATWSLRGKAYIPEATNYDETVITELTDGSLWMTVRANTSKKVVYQAFSFDKGATWTMSSPTSIFHCTTRFNITRLESGALLMVYNAASGRTKMTAALSYDDGKTWKHSVMLYASNSTYPDVSVTADGKIHIFFDSYRYKSDTPSTVDYFGRVFYTVLTEEYIRAHDGETLPADMLHIVSSRPNKTGTYAAGNYGAYTLENTEVITDSPIAGKTVIFLGSSVTYGSASFGVSFVDFLAKADGITAVKEAVSGTTLVDNGETSYVSRLKTLDTSVKADAFVCQLSTNDAKKEYALGTVGDGFAIADFDTQTIAGAIEYIIAYAKETWDCPVIFYTQAQYDKEYYGRMVDLLHTIRDKWGITVIDLWNDTAFNNITDAERALYLYDTIHPTMAGYREWFLPKFRETLTAVLQEK